MASDSNSNQLKTIDLKEIENQTPEKKGIISGLVNDIKQFLGIPSDRKRPNVKVEILDAQERDDCLQEIPLRKTEKIISDIYRVTEIKKELAPDGELIAPVDMSPDAVPYHLFHVWMKLDGRWQRREAKLKDDSCVHGPLVNMDMFCVAAELNSEDITVGPDGYKYVSGVDSRVSVDFPAGALDKDEKFQMTLDAPKVDRYKAYREYLPHLFDFVTGLSVTLTVDQSIKHSLKKNATVTLPVDKYTEEDGDVIFFSWQDDTADIIGPGKCSVDNTYCIDVNHFSSVDAYRVRHSVPTSTLLETAKYVSGHLNMCTLLTFIAFNHIETMPALVCDCVEAVSNRPDKLSAEYKQKGLHEIRLSRSRDIPIENNCRIKIELGGNLKLGPKISPSVLNMHFVEYSATNCAVIPIKKMLGRQTTSALTYRGPKNRWEHHVYFVLSPDQCSRNLNPDQTRVPETRVDNPGKSIPISILPRPTVKRHSTKTPLMPVSEVPVLSQQSLGTLSDVLTAKPDWRRIGIELDIRNDTITRIFNEADTISSVPGLELLLHWQRTTRGDPVDLVDKLATAFTEIDRGDIAEILRSAFENGRRLKRDDFK